jgi:hypothetical protein
MHIRLGQGSGNMLSQRHELALTNEDIRAVAPSVFALEPWQEMSKRYRFLPTIEVVERMRKAGFLPVAAFQGRSRLPNKQEFTRHALRFRRPQDLNSIEETVPELMLLNAHDGTSSYQMYFGFFRVICMNGLVACSAELDQIKARHSGPNNLVEAVLEGSCEIIEQAPMMLDRIDDMRSKQVTGPQQVAFAKAASELRESTIEIEPADLLRPRRYADMPAPDGRRTVWNTFNVVQENLLKGGTVGVGSTGRSQTTRGITSIGEDLKLNRALWVLAEELKKAA